MRKVLLVWVGIVVGAVLGIGVVWGEQSRPAAPERREWRQICDRVDNFDALNKQLQKRGRQGWELVAVTGGARALTCFKRPASR